MYMNKYYMCLNLNEYKYYSNNDKFQYISLLCLFSASKLSDYIVS